MLGLGLGVRVGVESQGFQFKSNSACRFILSNATERKTNWPGHASLVSANRRQDMAEESGRSKLKFL